MQHMMVGDSLGRLPGDYSYLARHGDARAQQNYLRQRAGRAGRPPHNFNMHPSAVAWGNQGRMLNDAEFQAQAIGYVTNSHQALMSYVEEILYTMSRFQNLVPINTMVPEGASTFAYRVIDRFGRGSFLGPRGDDAQNAMVSQRLVAYNVHYAGIIADWTYEDLRQSIFHGYPIDTATLEAGVIGCLEHIEQIVIEGSDEEDMTGLINDDQVSAQYLTETIAAMEPDEIVEFLQEEATDSISRTREVLGTEIRSPMVFYMPYSQAGRMVTLRTQTDMNVWQTFALNNSYTQKTGMMPRLIWLYELAGAGQTSDSDDTATDRIITGFRDMRILEFAIPIRPRILNIMAEGYRICAYLEYKISQLLFKRPFCFRYSDVA